MSQMSRNRITPEMMDYIILKAKKVKIALTKGDEKSIAFAKNEFSCAVSEVVYAASQDFSQYPCNHEMRRPDTKKLMEWLLR